ncbi:MAG: glycosyltransferase family 2 protein, partial [Bdellovibrionales bacterium]|nr:glycosyltransferase family 2 protein [Bdellovibrionales bacterium]
MSTRVTVIIPAYNAESFLQETLDSLYIQKFRDFQILVVDDGSTDRTLELLEKQTDPRLKFVSYRNCGAGASRQRAMESVDSELIAFLDADDLAHPDRLGAQLSLFEQDESLVLVGSGLELINQDGVTVGFRSYPESDSAIRAMLPIENPVAQPAVMIRRSIAVLAGGYRVNEGDGAEDYDLWLRMARLGKLKNLPDHLTRYRLHKNQFKASRTRLQLRASLTVRKRAVFEYGYPRSLRFV